MSELWADIGFKSINHYGEQLCGDSTELIRKENGEDILVLADGMGSGVKASILSTLTSKIISTMVSEGLSINECVSTVAATLPVCAERNAAYSTFTVISIKDGCKAEIIQYDNPAVIMIRNGDVFDYEKEELLIESKKIYKSSIGLQEDDVLTVISDGCPYAGKTLSYNYDWKWEDIAEFMRVISSAGYSAKSLSTMLVDEVEKLYGYQPGDDATACVVRIKKRNTVNVLFGPPKDPEDNEKVMSDFFGTKGMHIVCGGTTARIAADHLGKAVIPKANTEDGPVPPMSKIDGVDLVTEGVITMGRVLEYVKDYNGENRLFEEWSYKGNGAARIARALIDEATDVSFFAGTAVNPAYQSPDIPLSLNLKLNIVKELAGNLKEMGKRVSVKYC